VWCDVMRAEPPLFLDLSHRFVSADGLSFLCHWFDRSYVAWRHHKDDSRRPATIVSSSSDPSFIPPDLTNQLLLNVLKAWYRISVYQKQRCRDVLPKRPELFLQLR
jgi:hypothetical protein